MTTCLQANACKVEVVGGGGAGGGKGVDSTAGSEEALPAGIALAKHFKCVIAISGAVDIITDGSTKVLIRNGQVREAAGPLPPLRSAQ